MSSVQVIVNADDLGLSEQVNDAIFELMAERRLLSATLMANGPALRTAVARLKHFPQCSFGVHLNLTEFEPVAGGAEARWLVNDQGRLSRQNESALPTRAHLGAIYRELCAQVERLGSMGVPITHLDSHHHIHTKPYVFPVLKALQRRYGVRKVRIAKNLYAGARGSAALYWKKQVYNWALRTIYRTSTTDGFTEFASFDALDPARLLPIRTIELMVHPGDSRSAGETARLRSNWLATSCRPVELISYAQLS